MFTQYFIKRPPCLLDDYSQLLIIEGLRYVVSTRRPSLSPSKEKGYKISPPAFSAKIKIVYMLHYVSLIIYTLLTVGVLLRNIESS